MEWIGNTAHLTNKHFELYIYNGRELLARAAEAYHEQVLPLFGPEDPPPTLDQVKAALVDGLAGICERILRAIVDDKPFPQAESVADLFESLLVTKYECDRDAARARAVRTTDDAA